MKRLCLRQSLRTFVKCKISAGLANKQNKHVLVAPTSKGAPDCRRKCIHIGNVIFKFRDSFKYYQKFARASGARKNCFRQNIASLNRQIRSSRRGHGAKLPPPKQSLWERVWRINFSCRHPTPRPHTFSWRHRLPEAHKI